MQKVMGDDLRRLNKLAVICCNVAPDDDDMKSWAASVFAGLMSERKSAAKN
jgi:hypothetical protein